MMVDEKDDTTAIRTDHKQITTLIRATYNRIQWDKQNEQQYDIITLHKGKLKKTFKKHIEHLTKKNIDKLQDIEEISGIITNAFQEGIKASCKTKRKKHKAHGRRKLPKSIVDILKEVKTLNEIKYNIYKQNTISQKDKDDKSKLEGQIIKLRQKQSLILKSDKYENDRKLRMILIKKGRNLRTFWTIIKRREEATINSFTKIYGSQSTSPQETLKVVEEYQSKLLDENDNSEEETITNKESIKLRDTITKSDVQQTISKLKNGKSPGPDNIPNEIIKMVKDEVTEPLANMFNLALSIGTTPRGWNTGIMNLTTEESQLMMPSVKYTLPS